MSDQVKNQFEIEKLNLISFSPVTSTYNGDALQELSSGELQSKFSLQHSVVPQGDDHTVLLFLRLEGILRDPAFSDVEVASQLLITRFVFNYTDSLSKIGVVVKEENDLYAVAPLLRGLMLSIAYATTRGLLSSTFANTPFRNFNLPIRSVESLMKTSQLSVEELGVYLPVYE